MSGRGGKNETKKNVGAGRENFELKARMFLFVQGEARRQYSRGIVKAVNAVQAEKELSKKHKNCRGGAEKTRRKRMSGRGGEKSKQGQGCFCLREASAAGNRLAVLPRRSTMRKRKQTPCFSSTLPTKKECRGGEKKCGSQKVKFLRLYKASAAGNTLAVLARRTTPYRRKKATFARIFSPRPDKKDKGDIYVVPRGTRICLSR